MGELYQDADSGISFRVIKKYIRTPTQGMLAGAAVVIVAMGLSEAVSSQVASLALSIRSMKGGSK